MLLYSCAYDAYSHRCRLVMCEKEINAEIMEVDINNKPPEVSLGNPYNQVPLLKDHGLYLYESNIINEYLDDRFPHPQLMPTDIAQRGRTRLLLHNFDHQLFEPLSALVHSRNKAKRTEAARRLRDGAMGLVEFVSGKKYLLGSDFTMLDAALAPLLWRLNYYGVKLSSKSAPLLKYAERVFARPAFVDSLTVMEKAMRK